MLKHLPFLFFLSAPLATEAQTYEQLWKSVREATEKDLPKTALDRLHVIRAKAEKERNEVQLLRSYLLTIFHATEVSEDSGQVALKRLYVQAEKASTPLMKALWYNAIAHRRNHDYSLANDPQEVRQTREMLLTSFDNLLVLSEARAKDFLPLFTVGKQSEIFQNDLLHALAYDDLAVFDYNILPHNIREQLYRRIADHYQSLNNKSAELLFRLKVLEQEREDENFDALKAYDTLQHLAHTFASVPENVETYIAINELLQRSHLIDLLPGCDYTTDEEREAHVIRLSYNNAMQGISLYPNAPRVSYLQNFVNQCTHPKIEVSAQDGERHVLPHQPFTMIVKGRNVQQCTLRLRVVKGKSIGEIERDNHRYNEYVNLLPFSKVLSGHEQVLTFPVASPYEQQQQVLTFGGLDAGVYLVELLLNGKVEGRSLLSVSGMMVHGLVMSNGMRLTVVDATTGEPLPEASLHRYISAKKNAYSSRTYKLDDKGQYFFLETKNRRFYVYPETKTDRSASGMEVSNLYVYDNTDREAQTTLHLSAFTDRAIYRPGQSVKMSAILYAQTGDETAVRTEQQVEFSLYDANGKRLQTDTLMTDAFGVAHGEFQLPTKGLWGGWSIRAKIVGKQVYDGSAEFRVEEYKRPTIIANFERQEKAYTLGEKLQVEGTLKTYADFPIEGAKVHYTIREHTPFLHRTRGGLREVKGETQTNAEGRYFVPLQLPEKIERDWKFLEVKAVITAPNGETTEALTFVPISAHTSYIHAQWQKKWCKEAPQEVTVIQRTASDKNISTTGRYEFRQDGKVKTSGTFQTGVPFVPNLRDLPSGRYEVITTTQVDEPHVPVERRALTTDTTTVLIFSRTDKRMDRTAAGTLFTHSYLSDDQRTLNLLFATGSEDGIAFFDIVAKGKIVHSERFQLSNEITRRTVAYQEDWGDGARIVLSFVRHGQRFNQEFVFTRPIPQKKLKWQWLSFRSKLRPGQEEEWTLRLTRPDGTPVSASVMATMFDSSLDTFTELHWPFSVDFVRDVSSLYVAVNDQQLPWISYQKNYKHLPVSYWSFTKWRDDLEFDNIYSSRRGESIPFMVYERQGLASSKTLHTVGANLVTTGESSFQEQQEHSDEAKPQLSSPSNSIVPLRKNFSETAFFLPSLRTNEKGETSLRFLLPESTTTWNFLALGHTAGMDYIKHFEQIVAQKEFTLTPALPRFLREGDHTELPLTIANLSDENVKGTVRLTLLNAQTLEIIHTETQSFSIASRRGGNYSFFINTPQADGVVVRLVAESEKFSDGEEHLLPILSDRQEVIRTVPFTLKGVSTATIPLHNLWDKNATNRRLVVEATGNPIWQVAAALPFVYEVNPRNAIDWLGQYHASSIAHYLLRQNPELKAFATEDTATTSVWSERLRQNEDLRQLLLDETPWSPLADREAARTAKLHTLFDEASYPMRVRGALEKLQSLQNADGSWSWYPGMRSNSFVTLEIAYYLLRLRQMTGDEAADQCISKALSFVENTVQRRMKDKLFVPSYFEFRYLYACALAQEEKVAKLPASATVLLRELKSQLPKLDMESKGLAAVTLSILGEKKTANLALQSLLEHTVATPEMGRYFDSRRTHFMSSQYAFDTQIATIEAMKRLRPDSEVLSELCLWLLQSKRTQHWATTATTMEAIFAILENSKAAGSLNLSTTSDPLHITARAKGVALPNLITESPTHPHEGLASYGRANYDPSATEVQVQKMDNGLAWGAVYALSTAPSSVSSSSSELSVERFLERQKSGEWYRLKNGERLQRGETVRVVYILRAQRDFDFVSLRAPRPAGFVPTDPLSGYRWTETGGLYQVVHDASNDYFIETLPKGNYRISTTFRTDRAGRFTASPVRLQSVYAPEFVGFSTSATVEITQ